MKRIKKDFVYIIIILIPLILAFFGFYRCPFRFITGVPCPLCGLTRALRAFLKGEFYEAFQQYPLWSFIIVAIFLVFLNELKIIDPPKILKYIGTFLLSAAILICYVIKIKNGYF